MAPRQLSVFRRSSQNLCCHCMSNERSLPPVGLTAPCYTFIISLVISPRSIFKLASPFAALSWVFFSSSSFFLPFPRCIATISFPSPSRPACTAPSALSSRPRLSAETFQRLPASPPTVSGLRGGADLSCLSHLCHPGQPPLHH